MVKGEDPEGRFEFGSAGASLVECIVRRRCQLKHTGWTIYRPPMGLTISTVKGRICTKVISLL
jgi:hypothetical protein